MKRIFGLWIVLAGFAFAVGCGASGPPPEAEAEAEALNESAEYEAEMMGAGSEDDSLGEESAPSE